MLDKWHKKENPVFTGITRGVGGFGFGAAAGGIEPGFQQNGNAYSFKWTGDPIEEYSEFDNYLGGLPIDRPIWIKFDMWISPTTTKTVGAAAIVNEVGNGEEMAYGSGGGDYYTIGQRIISLSGMVTPANSYTSFSMVGSDIQLISNTNDDNESYFMNYRGDVVASVTNSNNFLDGNVNVARDGSVIATSTPIRTTAILGDSGLITDDSDGQQQSNHYVAFPLTNQATFLYRHTGNWSMIGAVNNTNDWYSAGPNGATISQITSQWGNAWNTENSRNTYTTMSDGIKSFWFHRKNSNYLLLCEMNFKTRSIRSDWINMGTTPDSQLQSAAETEEDYQGDQLFALNGGSAWAYQVGSGTNYQWDVENGWRSRTGMRRYQGLSLRNVVINGSYQNQTGQDVCGMIKSSSDYRVTFVDHGHDNGGLFNYGDDVGLGARDTDITVPGHYTVSNPPNTWWSS